MQHIKNIFSLGVKEIIELFRDKCMLILIVYSFTFGVYVAGIGTPDAVQRAPIAVVDEDCTQLSKRLTDAFLPPVFRFPKIIKLHEVDPGLDGGNYTFCLVIPANFEHDVLSGKSPQLQLNVDATRMSQAFVGSGYIQQIVNQEITRHISKSDVTGANVNTDTPVLTLPATLDLRNKFNPNLVASWFGGVNQLINNITMLAIVLIGAALIRERERGTLEHLLVMPVCPFEIMCAKIWSMVFVVLIATMCSVGLILKLALDMPIVGSVWLFALGVSLHLFAITSVGISLACIAHNMPQMGMLLILVLMPMNMLSGGQTPRESMPVWVQNIMEAAPTTHMVKLSQQILYRGASWDVVWKPFLALVIIGSVMFLYSLNRFRKTATQS